MNSVVVEHLYAYGFLPRFDSLQEAVERSTALEQEVALRAYQGLHGLAVDGVSGPDTQASLFAPRFCGHPDVMPVQLELARWPDSRLNWFLDPTSLQGVGLDLVTLTAAFDWAWNQWAAVCNIQPRQVQTASECHVLIQFGAIDGPQNVLAWSELANNTQSRKAQRYDRQEPWVVSDNPAARSIDLARVAAHEIGHVLGIPHISRGNLLQPTYDTRIRSPQAGDIQEAVARYGHPIAPPPPPPTPPSPQGWTIMLQGTGEITSVSVPGFRVTRMV